jgi:phosphoribosylanthranilate isomerase
MVLVDSPDKSIPTDIEVAKSMVHECSRAGVAGGISLDNLHLYMDIKPYLIDISRGVEVSPGIKDHKKLIELFKRVKGI